MRSTSSNEVVRKDRVMTKKRKLSFEVLVFMILYGVLVVMVILGHNILDIGYLIILTIYIIRLFLCRRKKNKSCK